MKLLKKIFITFFALSAINNIGIANTCKESDQQEEEKIRSICQSLKT